MSTEITRHSTNTALTIAEDQTGFTDQQIAALRQIGLGANTQADVEVFFHQAKRSGLDPFRREIYMITRKTKNGPKATSQTGHPGTPAGSPTPPRTSRSSGPASSATSATPRCTRQKSRPS